jgi:hypothetical protein
VPLLCQSPGGKSRWARFRFVKERRELLAQQLGHDPTASEAILIDRISEQAWQLCLLDRRIRSGIETLPVRDLRDLMRMAHGTDQRLRLGLASLGIVPKDPWNSIDRPLPPAPKPTVGEMLASIHGMPQDATEATEDDASEGAEA